MARLMACVALNVRKGTAYWMWSVIRMAMTQQLLEEREVKKALSALIELGLSRDEQLERATCSHDPATQLWQDVFYFMRAGALSSLEVKANLCHLIQLGFYAPIPKRVRDTWPSPKLVAKTGGGRIEEDPGRL